MSDLTPDTDELLQEEHVPQHLTPIPVVVQGPTRVVELPAQDLVLGQMDVDNVTPLHLFYRDPRRKRLTLIPSGGALRMASSQKACQAGSGFILPVGTAHTITAFADVWVMASSGAATTVSYAAEQWAD